MLFDSKDTRKDSYPICCGGYQPQVSSVRKGRTKKAQEAQLLKKAGGGSSPASRIWSTRSVGSHSTEVKREQLLCWKRTDTNHSEQKTRDTEARAGSNTAAKTARASCEETTCAKVLWKTVLVHTRSRALCPGCFFLTLPWSWPDTRLHQRTGQNPRCSNEASRCRKGSRNCGGQLRKSHISFWNDIGEISVLILMGICAALTQYIDSNHNAEPLFQS